MRCSRKIGSKAQYQCKGETKEGSQLCPKHQRFVKTKERAASQKRWRRTISGIALHLRSKLGYEEQEAATLARRLCDPNERCSICGVPAYILKGRWKSNYPFPCGGKRNNRRLTPDRINTEADHRISNTRLVCFGCNSLRNKERMRDEQVLIRMRRDWTLIIGWHPQWLR